jgi:hypothetical protein
MKKRKSVGKTNIINNIKMKKLFLLILFTLILTPGFAERETIPATIMQSQAFKGQIKEIILPDSADGIKHEIVVINSQEKQMRFILTPGLGVYGPAWEVLNIKKIKPNDKVLVEYTTNKKGDVNKAISITIMGSLEK